MTTIPAGFSRHTRSSAVTNPWEPIFANPEPGSVRLGLIIGEQHCNSRGFLHGGVIAALADNAMGLTLSSVRTGPGNVVTTALSLDYFGTSRLGQWLEIVPRVVSIGRSSGIVDAIVRANATFRVLT